MPPFLFRLRWRFEPGRSIENVDSLGPIDIAEDVRGCTLQVLGAETRRGGQILALMSGPFESHEAAAAAGAKVMGALLLHSLRSGFSVLLRPRVPAGKVTDYGKKLLAGGKYDVVHDEGYGLQVYEQSGTLGFAEVGEVGISINGPALTFVQGWSSSAGDFSELSHRLLFSYDLYASTRFETSTRTQFLLLVMAIEALAQQGPRTDEELAVIEQLKSIVVRSGLNSDACRALVGGLGMLKLVSIGHACRLLIERSISDGHVSDARAADHFAQCYRIRGKIVHGGSSPDPATLANHTVRLHQTVTQLLAARLSKTW